MSLRDTTLATAARSGGDHNRSAKSLATAIVKRHFGRSPKKLVRLGGGLTNDVFACKVGHDHCVIRLNTDATKIQDYLKEQWAMEQARAAGVPTPEVMEVGSDQGCAYLIARHESGVTPCDHPRRLEVLKQLGALSAAVHSVRTHGFGKVFDWSANRLSQRTTWKDFLDIDLAAESRIALLQRHSMLTADGAKEARSVLEEMRGWRRTPVLHHGDLRLKNVLVDPKTCRIAALIDWEHCLSAPSPCWDFSIALHDLGIDEKEAFLEGYGLSPLRYRRLAAQVRTLNLLNYAPVVALALDRRDRTTGRLAAASAERGA